MHESTNSEPACPHVVETVTPTLFRPSKLAAGPFLGVQGGVIAAMLARAARASAPEAFHPLSQRTEFLRRVPLVACRISTAVVHRGRRIVSVDATLTDTASTQTYARANAVFVSAVDIELEHSPVERPWGGLVSPERLKSGQSPSPHGEPWLMDALEGRAGPDGAVWFRWKLPLFSDGRASSYELALGPADWTHGIARPGYPGPGPASAWPNSDLTVHLNRMPDGEWLGLLPRGRWSSAGRGIGFSDLFDCHGPFGRVAMGVVLIAK
ncbi:MAG: thioesterase family protein [Proteobacteria bacterium]|nr:thioesterase family protein [Pseudomonadota bacterium]